MAGKIVKALPLDKMPIIIAGGSFNAKGIQINVEEGGIQILEKVLLSKIPIALISLLVVILSVHFIVQKDGKKEAPVVR